MSKILSFLLILLTFLSCIKDSSLNKNALKDEIRKEILDSIKKYDSTRIVLYKYKVKKGKSILIYDNKTWEYNNKKTATEAQILGFSQTVNKVSKNPSIKAKSKNKKRTKNNYSNSSTISGYCGHPTKSGGSCSRRVKGGGYCWQHS